MVCKMPIQDNDDQSHQREVDRRRDAMLLRALKTPPQQRPKRERKPKAAPGEPERRPVSVQK